MRSDDFFKNYDLKIVFERECVGNREEHVAKLIQAGHLTKNLMEPKLLTREHIGNKVSKHATSED